MSEEIPEEKSDDQHTAEQNLKPENIRLNRIKAIDITIDSLKQYVTLSTVSIAGLLAFYNGNGKNGNPIPFAISVIAFLLCALASIWTVNTFINEVHFGETNARKLILRIYNFIAITLFFVGVVSSGFFVKGSLSDLESKNQEKGQIVITTTGAKIEIVEKIKGSVTISNDSLTNQIQIIIRNQ